MTINRGVGYKILSNVSTRTSELHVVLTQKKTMEIYAIKTGIEMICDIHILVAATTTAKCDIIVLLEVC